MTEAIVKPVLDATVAAVFGADTDPLEAVFGRARESYPGRPLILWQGDAATFEFSAVLGDSEQLLGYAAERWLEPGFWAEHIVYPDDRGDAIAFCALATGRGSDHVFEYRALSADQRVVWLEDHVKVILGTRGVATHLRGLMFDVTVAKQAAASSRPELYRPSRALLDGMVAGGAV